jgi:hypothetical protein
MVGKDKGLKKGRFTERLHEGELAPIFSQHANHDQFIDQTFEFSIEFMEYN